MASKSFFNCGIEIASWLVLLLLSIGLTFFVRDIWNDYQEGKTNDRVYSKSINYYRHPTIAICFEPQVNETTLKEKYDKTISDLDVFDSGRGMLDVTVPVQTVLDEVHFKVGRDFSLFLVLSGHESNHNYIYVQINNTLNTNEHNMLQVEELPSVFYGACTVLRISDKLKGAIKLANFIQIKFATEDENELPLVNIYFTSDNNFAGAAFRQWFEGEVYALAIDPKHKLDYEVHLKQQIRKRLTEASYCNPEMVYYKCMAERLVSFSLICKRVH